jgi:N utilization substance protein A
MDVKNTPKGPQIYLSRSHPGIVKKLFELEVPEIQDGIVEIKHVAREAGYRTKIAVYTADENVDPIGACVGTRGARVRNVVEELFGEKIDIIVWSEDPEQFISKSLSPAKPEKVILNEEEKTALVIVPDTQLSLAIGKEGQNVRLAAKLCGWKIDIKSASQYEEQLDDEDNDEIQYVDDDLAEEIHEMDEEIVEVDDEIDEEAEITDETSEVEAEEK